MKTAVIEFLLSVNIPTIFEMEYVWTKEETFVTLFLLLHHAALLAKKSDCFKFTLKGDIYHQMSNCIKSWILIVYGLLSDCLFFAVRFFAVHFFESGTLLCGFNRIVCVPPECPI